MLYLPQGALRSLAARGEAREPANSPPAVLAGRWPANPPPARVELCCAAEARGREGRLGALSFQTSSLLQTSEFSLLSLELWKKKRGEELSPG